jgi:hypothetical protein
VPTIHAGACRCQAGHRIFNMVSRDGGPVASDPMAMAEHITSMIIKSCRFEFGTAPGLHQPCSRAGGAVPGLYQLGVGAGCAYVAKYSSSICICVLHVLVAHFLVVHHLSRCISCASMLHMSSRCSCARPSRRPGARQISYVYQGSSSNCSRRG